MAERRRLDAELVRRGLSPSRQAAQELIDAGRVRVGGAPAERASRLVSAAEPVEIVGPPPRFVGRGGEKLAGALAAFGLDVTGWRCLDAGASTGGFTDCLLQAGAREVVAVDVGHGQLHERLRADPRVDVRERTNVRMLDAAQIGGPVDLVVADLSFISLRLVAATLVDCTRPGGSLVVLVKPQFEVGRAVASRGKGVVRDPDEWAGVLRDVAAAFEAAGASIMGAVPSPLRGADGNVEFFLHAVTPPVPALEPKEVAARLAAAVDEVRAR